jgi:hypothetical protein
MGGGVKITEGAGKRKVSGKKVIDLENTVEST